MENDLDIDSAPIQFKPLSEKNMSEKEYRKVNIPTSKMGVFRNNWEKIYEVLVEHLKLQVRMNPKAKIVEVKVPLMTNSDFCTNQRLWCYPAWCRFFTCCFARLRS